MRLDVAFLHAEVAGRELAGWRVVAIDVLRATTTAVTALHNGARAIRPVLEPPDAVADRQRLAPGSCLLGGERRGLPIAGFDLGNSPREYTAETVRGKTVILTTSNGTRLLHAASEASGVFLGAVVNAAAVARRLAKEDGPVLLACAGRLGRFSWEDTLCAGQIIAGLLALADKDGGSAGLQLTTAASAALGLYHRERGDLGAAIGRAPHARYLASIGLWQDVLLCGRPDTLEVVPQRSTIDPKEWTI